MNTPQVKRALVSTRLPFCLLTASGSITYLTGLSVLSVDKGLSYNASDVRLSARD